MSWRALPRVDYRAPARSLSPSEVSEQLQQSRDLRWREMKSSVSAYERRDFAEGATHLCARPLHRASSATGRIAQAVRTRDSRRRDSFTPRSVSHDPHLRSARRSTQSVAAPANRLSDIFSCPVERSVA